MMKMQKPTAEVAAPRNLPEDMCREILLRVPARSTYVCKCVSKTWRKIISQPKFIKEHLKHTLLRNKPSLMICGRRYKGKWNMISHAGEFDHETDALELKYPIQLKKDRIYGGVYGSVELLGSCNGLVALYYDDDRNHEIIRIWNPATKKAKKLPKSQLQVLQDSIVIWAFGYAQNIEDYKLVKVVPLEGRRNEGCYAEVYTLGEDYWWRTIQHIPYKFPYKKTPGVLFKGDLHWLGETCAKDASQVVIVSFNVCDERFSSIQLPAESMESNYVLKSVGVLEDCLCVVASNVAVGIVIWVMQTMTYGAQESWVKRHIISVECIVNHGKDVPVFLKEYKYLRSLNNGKILLSLSDNLVIYDPECGSLTKSNVLIPSTWFVHDNYFGSLVPLVEEEYMEEDDEPAPDTEEEED